MCSALPSRQEVSLRILCRERQCTLAPLLWVHWQRAGGSSPKASRVAMELVRMVAVEAPSRLRGEVKLAGRTLGLERAHHGVALGANEKSVYGLLF